jgi:hypothetical protein
MSDADLSLKILMSSPTDLPTLKARVDDPQSRRGSGHRRCERSRGLIHGRKTAREASQDL